MPSLESSILPRAAEGLVQAALLDTRVILIIGPRQCGKTTLARQFAGPERPYLTLDDETTLATALADPVGFIRNLDVVIIDEIQRAPSLLLAIKKSVDEDERPGRFLLTGSADVLTLPKVADSLAGRMEIIRLLPLSQAEVLRQSSNFSEMIMTGNVTQPDTVITGDDLVEIVLTGGYPEMRRRPEAVRRRVWARDYLTTIIERDIRDIITIDKADAIGRLPFLLASQSGQLVNYTQVSSDLGLDSKTVKKYTNILEQIFIVKRVDPWAGSARKRVARTSKLQFLDSGLLATLLNVTPESVRATRTSFGCLLETFVFSEVLKLASISRDITDIYYYRDKDKYEVDLLIEYGFDQLVGIEVKAAATVYPVDFAALRRIAGTKNSKLKMGIVMYDGDTVVPFGDGMFAVPVSCLWGMTPPKSVALQPTKRPSSPNQGYRAT